MAKYDPLLRHLSTSDAPVLTLSFWEIERIIGADLPPSARRFDAWWGNSEGVRHVQCEAWMNAGYRATDLDRGIGLVTFRRS